MKIDWTRKITLFLVVSMFIFRIPASADIIFLKKGGRIEGMVVNTVANAIFVETRRGKIRVEKPDIESITQSDATEVLETAKLKEAATPSRPLSRNLKIYFGQKRLSESYYTDLGTEDQGEIGATYDFGVRGLSFNFLLGYFSSQKENSVQVPISPSLTQNYSSKDKTQEIRLGIRKIWDGSGKGNVFAGAGPGYFISSSKSDITEAHGQQFPQRIASDGLGWWADVGGGIEIMKNIELGLCFSYSYASIKDEDEGVSLKVGGTHVLGFLGYHW